MTYRDDDYYSRRDDLRREEIRRDDYRRDDYRRDDLRREDHRREDNDYLNRREDERQRIEDDTKKTEDFYDGLRTRDYDKALRSTLPPDQYLEHLEKRAQNQTASEEIPPEPPAEEKPADSGFAERFAGFRRNKVSDEEMRAQVLADLEKGDLLQAVMRLTEHFNIEADRPESFHLLESVFPLTEYDKRMNRQKLDLIREILRPIPKASLFSPGPKRPNFLSDLLNPVPEDRLDWAFTIGRLNIKSKFGLMELDNLIGKIKFGLIDPLQTQLDAFRNELRAHLLITDL